MDQKTNIPAPGKPARAPVPKGTENKKRIVKRKRKHTVRNIIIALLSCILAAVFILYFVGCRYIAYNVTRGDQTVKVRFIGLVDGDGDPRTGRVYYPDCRAKINTEQGSIDYSNGDEYVGGLYKLMKHGSGYIRYANGDTYDGTFVYDRLSGEGTFTYADTGNVYKGEFSEGEMTGKGKFTWADGSYYDGHWENGKRSGSGVYVDTDTTVYEGEYENDLPNGRGIRTYSDGSYYDGNWVDGVRSGEGTYVYADGTKFVGSFENGAPADGKYYMADEEKKDE